MQGQARVSLRIACDVCCRPLESDARSEAEIRGAAISAGWALLDDHGGRFNAQTAWWILDICRECAVKIAKEETSAND